MALTRILRGAISTTGARRSRFGADGGSIINLSSIVGSHPVAGALLYASTKGAIETLTRGLALEKICRTMSISENSVRRSDARGDEAGSTRRQTMRVIVFVKATDDSEKGFLPTPEAMEAIEAMGRFNDELRKAGIMLVADGLKPSSQGSVLRSMVPAVRS